MRKNKYNELKEIVYESVLDFYYDQYEQYFTILINDFLYDSGINYDNDKTNWAIERTLRVLKRK